MTKREQQLRATRKTTVEAMTALHAAANPETGLLSADQQADYDKHKATLAQIDQQIAAEQAHEALLKTTPATTTVAVVTDEADRPFTSLGEQLVAIARAQSPRGAFEGAGTVDPRLLGAASGGNTSVGADGGYLVQKDHAVDLLGKGMESGALASRCDRSEIGPNSDGLEVVTIDETSRATGSRWGGVQVYRRAEADTVTSTKVKFGTWERRLEDLMGIAYITERGLQDAPAIGGVFEKAFAEEFGFKIDDEIYRGSGAGECQGIKNAACTVSVSKETGQLAATIVAENIVKMWSRVHPRSRFSGVWVYNVEGDTQLPLMQIGTGASGQLVYMPPGGLSASPYGTIYGRPVIPIEHADALGTVGDIAFVDLSQYKLIAKGGTQKDESIHVRFLYNERTFRWVTRINGAPKWKTALTPYKGTSTLSPFVTLATRA